MKKNYYELFKIEHSNDSICNYTVFRKNFTGSLKKVATVKLIPSEHADINFLRKLPFFEKRYIESYFLDLANLKIDVDSPDNIYYYNIYRKNEYGEFELVAISDISKGSITAIKDLKPHECSYLRDYLKPLIHNV